MPSIPYSVTYKLTNPFNWTSGSISYGDTPQEYISRGSNIDGWRRKLRKNENAQTALSGSKRSFDHSPGSLSKTTLAGYQFSIDGVFGANLVESKGAYLPPNWTADWNAFKQSAAGNISNDFESFMGIVFLAEFRKTVQLLRNPVASLARLIESFKLASVGKTAEELANLWLEFQLGVKPLLLDIENIATILQSMNGQQELLRSVHTGDLTDRSSGSDIRPEFYLGSFIKVRPTISYETEYSVLRKAVALGTAVLASHNGSSRTFLDKIGISLRAVPSAIWELIPYSFVIDYFYNIGDAIASGRYASGDYNWSFSSYKVEATTNVSVTWEYFEGFGGMNQWLDAGTGNTCVIAAKSVQREPVLSFLPTMKIISDLPVGTQIGNIVALITKAII